MRNYESEIRRWIEDRFFQNIKEPTTNDGVFNINRMMKNYRLTREEREKHHPVRSFFYYKTLPVIFNIIRIPSEIKRFVMNYLGGVHYLEAVDLKRGKYFDLDKRILYANFGELEKFVEIEYASIMFDIASFEGKNGVEKYGKKPSYLWGIQNETAGKDYLSQRTDEADKEIEELYLWWKVRKNSNAYKDSGLAEFNRKYPDGYDHPEEVEKERKELRKLYSKLSDEYYQEDTDMLVRLMKIRGALWT